MHTDYPKFIGMPAVRTDGGWSVYGHVITKLSRMGRLPQWSSAIKHEIKINQITLKKKSNVKTESTLGKQQAREIRRVLDSEGIIMLQFKTRKNNNRDDSQDDFNLQF